MTINDSKLTFFLLLSMKEKPVIILNLNKTNFIVLLDSENSINFLKIHKTNLNYLIFLLTINCFYTTCQMIGNKPCQLVNKLMNFKLLKILITMY